MNLIGDSEFDPGLWNLWEILHARGVDLRFWRRRAQEVAPEEDSSADSADAGTQPEENHADVSSEAFTPDQSGLTLRDREAEIRRLLEEIDRLYLAETLEEANRRGQTAWEDLESLIDDDMPRSAVLLLGDRIVEDGDEETARCLYSFALDKAGSPQCPVSRK